MLWVEQGNETSGKQPNNHITTEFCSENDQSGQFQNEIFNEIRVVASGKKKKETQVHSGQDKHS